jgi:hypothetical protein
MAAGVCTAAASASVTKVTKSGDVLTVCLTNGHRSCASTSATTDHALTFLLF